MFARVMLCDSNKPFSAGLTSVEFLHVLFRQTKDLREASHSSRTFNTTTYKVGMRLASMERKEIIRRMEILKVRANGSRKDGFNAEQLLDMHREYKRLEEELRQK